jgi:hypothetical protein
MIKSAAPKILQFKKALEGLHSQDNGPANSWNNTWIGLFKMATTIASKLPSNWYKRRFNMAYWVVYLMKVYNITPTLIINNDQTSVHLIPTTR